MNGVEASFAYQPEQHRTVRQQLPINHIDDDLRHMQRLMALERSRAEPRLKTSVRPDTRGGEGRSAGNCRRLKTDLRVADMVAADGAGPMSRSRFGGGTIAFIAYVAQRDCSPAGGRPVASGRMRAALCTIDNHLGELQ